MVPFERNTSFTDRLAAAYSPTDRAAPPCHYIPLRENRRFVGRDRTLNTLKEMLFVRKEWQKAAIVGLGGIGKTQVALQFAYWAKTQQAEYSIFWVPALSRETFEQAYTERPRKLPIQRSSNVEDVKRLRPAIPELGCGGAMTSCGGQPR